MGLSTSRKRVIALQPSASASGIQSISVTSPITINNTDPLNPIIGTTVKVPIEIANYSALPAAGTSPGQTYIVLASQGTQWLPGSLGGTYYGKGYYYDNGVSYTYSEVPYNATQAEVNTGTNTDKFVTPSTLKNWTSPTFVPYTGASTTVDLGSQIILVGNGSASAPSIGISSAPTSGFWKNSTYAALNWGSGGVYGGLFEASGLYIKSTGILSFLNSDAESAILRRVGANIIGMGTSGSSSAQTFRIFGDNNGNKYLNLTHDGTNGLITANSGVVKIQGLTITSSTGTLTLANSSSLITTGTFDTTFATGFSGTITLPTATSTLYSTQTGSISSSQLLTSMSDETGTGALVFATAPTFTTSITTPLIIGGTGVGSQVVLQSTIGNGTSSVAGIVGSVGNNGATNAFNVYNDGQFLVGSSTRNATAFGIFRIGQGTSFIDAGERTTGEGAIWLNVNSATNTANNYTIAGGSTVTRLNSPSNLQFMIANTVFGSFSSTVFNCVTPAVTFTPNATSSGVVSPLTFTAPASTGQTAGTESITTNWNMSATMTHASNTNITTQRDFYIKQRTHAFASATGTIADGYTFYVDAGPTVGTNAAITRSWSAGFNGNVDIIGTTYYPNSGGAAVVGNATLVGGTITVNTTRALTGSYILLTSKTNGGTVGNISYTIVNATSFTINSTNPLDTSTYTWLIINGK